MPVRSLPWVSFSLPAGGFSVPRLKDERNRGSDWLLERDVYGQFAKLTEGRTEEVGVSAEAMKMFFDLEVDNEFGLSEVA